MSTNFIFAIISVVFISLLSLIGILFISFSESKLRRMIFCMVSIGVGALLGDALIHLIPESFEHNADHTLASTWIILGFLSFFVLEKFFRWHHCHNIEDEHAHHHPVGYMSLAADAFHNFLDGLLIGSAYMLSIEVGIATTLAVILHELPQELSDFSILIHSGFSRNKALLFNFISSSTAILGALIASTSIMKVEALIGVVIPFAAGSFIYVAASDLVPELHKETSGRKSFLQFICIVIGFGLMYAVGFIDQVLGLH
jgi:zinc and cadmium transporter